MERDVIISAYATPPARVGVDAQPLSAFAEPPLLVQVTPGEGTTEAGRYGGAAARLRDHTGSILRPLLRSALPQGVRPRRVALVSFSAGWGFLSAVINSPDREWVDAVILVDSLAIPRSFASGPLYLSTGWQQFLDQAGAAGVKAPLVVSSCVTGIPSLSPLVGSTSQSTHLALERASAQGATTAPAFPLEQLVAQPPESWPLTITGGNPPSTEVFQAPPTPDVQQAGNVVGCFYPGKGGPAHIFQAWHVQPRLFRTFLAPWWQAVPCEQPLSGIGAAECALSRRAPPDLVGERGGIARVLLAAGLVVTVGYATRKYWW